VSPAIPAPEINTLIIRLAVPPPGQWFTPTDLKLVDEAARSIKLSCLANAKAAIKEAIEVGKPVPPIVRARSPSKRW
jgi:hypothetical protein